MEKKKQEMISTVCLNFFNYFSSRFCYVCLFVSFLRDNILICNVTFEIFVTFPLKMILFRSNNIQQVV